MNQNQVSQNYYAGSVIASVALVASFFAGVAAYGSTSDPVAKGVITGITAVTDVSLACIAGALFCSGDKFDVRPAALRLQTHSEETTATPPSIV